MRPYVAHQSVSGSNSVSVTQLSNEAFGVIDSLAQIHDVGRSYVAQAILDYAVNSPESVAEIVKAKLGEPKRQRPRIKYADGKRVVPNEAPREVRMQDEVCLSINGYVPAGGCRYPNCGCK